MAKELGKDARLYLQHMDIHLKSFEMEQTMESQVIQSGQYAQDFDDFDILTANGSFNLSAYLFDDYKKTYAGTAEALDQFFFDQQIDSAGAVVSVPSVLTFSNKDAMTDGDWALITQGFAQMQIAPNKDGLVPLRVQVRETGPISVGQFLRIEDIGNLIQAEVDNGATIDFGAAPPVRTKLRATLHVLDVVVNSGTFTDATIRIESGVATPIVSPTTRHTFTASADKDQQYADITISTNDRYWRATAVGGSGTFDINLKVAVALAIS